MTKNAGFLVECASGKGRIINGEQLLNGKVIVHLENPDGSPVLDERGNEKKVLVDRDKIKYRGFVD